ncbi:MAG: glycosyltransferase family protein [Parafilimonas sp.]
MAVGQFGKYMNIAEAGIIIQARMDSVRLPGKVLMKLGNSTVFEILIKRLKKAGLPIVLATSKLASNNKLIFAAEQLKISCFRGSEENVLSRYYEAAKMYNLKIIVRVTGDNPFTDGELLRYYVEEYIRLKNINLYISAGGPKKTFPTGISFEIFSFEMLEAAYKNATDIKQQEHVTPYFYTNPDVYDVVYITNESDKSAYRLTLDTEEDLVLIKTLVEKYNADNLNYKDIIEVLDRDQNLSVINKGIKQKKWNE